MNITTLRAATTISNWELRKMNPQEIDTYARQNLAHQLADAIINEDLIKINTDIDFSTFACTIQTQLKIIQE